MADDDNPITYAKLPPAPDRSTTETLDEPAPFSKQQYISAAAAAPSPSEEEAIAAPPGYANYTSLPIYQPRVYDGDTYAAVPGAFQYADGTSQPIMMVVPVEEDLSCAYCGVLLSWIPIIGWISFCMNSNAPRGSRRRLLAKWACWIATAVFAFNTILLIGLRA